MAHPLVCDLTGSGETPGDRLQEYRRLFDTALLGRLRTASGIRFRFGSEGVDEERLRDLAAREQACCPFFDMEIRRVGDELWWDTEVSSPDAGFVLDEFYRLPDLTLGAEQIQARVYERGLQIVTGGSDPVCVDAVDVNASNGVGIRRVITSTAGLSEPRADRTAADREDPARPEARLDSS